MAITQQQMQNTLNLRGVFSLISGAATITDISAWSSLGVTSAKILLQINDPTLDLVYQNPGFNTAIYTAPNLDVFNSIPTFSFTLPQDINLAYLQGSYTINLAIQLISPAGTQTFSYTVYENVSSCCNGIVANGTPTINYLNAQVSVTDNTNYGNFISVANTLTIYPDPTTGQSAQTATGSGTPYTLIWQPPSGQKTYTGNWKWTLSSVLTYVDAQTQTTTTCLVTGSGAFEVNQNPICKVLCFLNKYVTQVQLAQAGSIVNAALMQSQLLQAQGYFALLLGQNDCGKNGEAYVSMIYKLIGVINPNDGSCDSCGGTNVTPLIPTQSINGTNGTNGTSFRIGTGVPSNGLGANGDTYLDSATWNIYDKAAGAWSLVGNIQGATGAAGAAGAAFIWSDATDSRTATTGSFTTIKSGATDFTNAQKNLTVVGDVLKIKASVLSASLAGNAGVQILFNASQVGATASILGGICDMITYDIAMTLTDATAGAQHVRVETVVSQYLNFDGTSLSETDSYIRTQDFTALNFNAANQTFVLQVNQTITLDCLAKEWSCEIIKFATSSLSGDIKYLTPFTTTNAVQSYPNIIGSFGGTLIRVYLDGELLTSADWSYNNATDTLTFIIAITGASEVAGDYA